MTGHLSQIRQTGDLTTALRSTFAPSKRSHHALILGFFCSLLTFIIYYLTLAPDITWANYSSDAGELITAAVTLGIPHPPGYPTYTLLGKIVSLLPLGTIAFRFNLFSAVSASLAAGLITAAAAEYTKIIPNNLFAALSAGLTIAFTQLVWSQAVVTEVYTLNLLFIAAVVWAFFGRRSPILVGLFLGLAVTTHLTSLILLPMFLILTNQGSRLRLVLGIILGLSPFLIIPFLAEGNSPIIWGNPATLSGWLWLISGQLYQSNLAFPNQGELLQHISNWSRSIIGQFSLIGWLIIAVGVAIDEHEKRTILLILLTAAGFITFTFFYQTTDSLLFMLPAIVLLSLPLAVGFTKLNKWALLFPIILLVINFNQQNLTQDHTIRPQVDAIFLQIPTDALVLTPGDPSIFTLWYFKYVEDQRTDLTYVDSNLFAFDWYRDRLQGQNPDLKGLEIDDLDLFLALNKNSPICTVSIAKSGSIVCH